MESTDPLIKLIETRFDIVEEYLLKQCAIIKSRLDIMDTHLEEIEIRIDRIEKSNNIVAINKKNRRMWTK